MPYKSRSLSVFLWFQTSKVQYLVVQVAEHEGVGNQMLKMITGLIFAVNMKRCETQCGAVIILLVSTPGTHFCLRTSSTIDARTCVVLSIYRSKTYPNTDSCSYRALVVLPLTPGAKSSLDPVIDFFTECKAPRPLSA